MRKRIPKPFSELGREAKIVEAKAAIARLNHPHNRGSREIEAAIARWRETLRRLEKEGEDEKDG